MLQPDSLTCYPGRNRDIADQPYFLISDLELVVVSLDIYELSLTDLEYNASITECIYNG